MVGKTGLRGWSWELARTQVRSMEVGLALEWMVAEDLGFEVGERVVLEC